MFPDQVGCECFIPAALVRIMFIRFEKTQTPHFQYFYANVAPCTIEIFLSKVTSKNAIPVLPAAISTRPALPKNNAPFLTQ
ncbi:MAG: hypothetical protein H6574_20500 [Lewinellaceae bacterium]|nr:hypothetical protein [Saprospiraceae bacterium]MCB9333446.1 hypothetical protein [Lewinellaceae bacterium]